MLNPYLMLSDDELNIKVAKRLGYSVYHYDKDYPNQCFYMLMDSNYEPVADMEWKRFTEEYKTRRLHTGERKTEAEAWKDAPQFSTDLNAAFTLLDGKVCSATIANVDGGWHVGLLSNQWRDYEEVETDNLARAICVVWLMWKDNQK